MGRFATGVTVITTVQPDGTPVGCTVSAFCSLSLDPPLVLVCIGKNRSMCHALPTAPGYVVNILSADQHPAALAFSRSGRGPFGAVATTPGPYGIPRLSGALAHVECDGYDVLDGGDHLIVLGRVTGLAVAEGRPLLYYQGRFMNVPEGCEL
ncbi:flavin reductase [Actinomadura rubrisoli]|uniref:Flavin reductase n=2 Tax=Actinomadura rubrisoli TaxID=2530368 RepID=A0A4R5ANY6_9ACTN|nr:flavin reductase [Actinomadura rubrisoli]